MDTTRLRRAGALLASAALLASLTVATVAAPASAARPKCDGKVATIVSHRKVIRGTSRADVIVAKGNKNNTIFGKGGRDRICGGKGKDKIFGGPGNDRLFGGSQNDYIKGQGGKDDIFGFTGNDTLLDGGSGSDFIKGGGNSDTIDGGPGDDRLFGNGGGDVIFGDSGDDFLRGGAGADDLDGGDDIDECIPEAGNGTVINCEEADLAVEVTGPASAPEGLVTLKVKVTNNGPAASSYRLDLDRVDGDAECDQPPASISKPVLESGDSRSLDIGLNCSIEGAEPGITLMATVIADANDPNPGNDSDENTRTLLF
jgi:hypothetical protein